MPDSVAIFSNNVTPGVGHIAKAVAERAGSGPVAMFATRETSQPLYDHGITFAHLERLARLDIRRHGEAPKMNARTLLVTWSHWVPYVPEQMCLLQQTWEHAKRRVLLYDAAYGHGYQRVVRQARELVKHPWLRQADEVCYMSIWPSADLFAAFRKRYSYCTGPNVDILFEPQLERQLHLPYDVDQRRPYFLFVSGALGLPSRVAILSLLEKEFDRTGRIQRHPDEPSGNTREWDKKVYWRAGGDGVSPTEYIQNMSASDFVLCLPGGFWTTRPYEALARGCIPILDDRFLHSYDVDWKDGENCVLVTHADQPASWVEAVRRASEIPEHRVRSMRRHIETLSEARLRPAQATERLLTKLGLC